MKYKCLLSIYPNVLCVSGTVYFHDVLMLERNIHISNADHDDV